MLPFLWPLNEQDAAPVGAASCLLHKIAGCISALFLPCQIDARPFFGYNKNSCATARGAGGHVPIQEAPSWKQPGWPIFYRLFRDL